MRRNRRTCTAWALLLVVAAATGCYTTRIESETARSGEAVTSTASGSPSAAWSRCLGRRGRVRRGRRLVRREPPGRGSTILLNIAVGVGSSLVGVAICDDSANAENYAACVSGAGALGGFLIGSRSVRYQCRASSTGP